MPEAMEGPFPFAVHTLFNEETTVEREIIDHLKAAKLGWSWRSRETLKAQRPDEREVLLLPLLREKLKALNPAVLTDDARVNAIITKLQGCRDNQQWLAWLKGGVNYKFDAAENAQDVRLIDFENLEANDWWVTNQFSIEGRSTRRPDIVLLINGIPIIVIEAKTASRGKPDWREGAKQLGMYAEEIDQLFYTNAYGVGVNETRMMYGVPGRRLQFWLQWRDRPGFVQHRSPGFGELNSLRCLRRFLDPDPASPALRLRNDVAGLPVVWCRSPLHFGAAGNQ